jgi:hypothetical protein
MAPVAASWRYPSADKATYLSQLLVPREALTLVLAGLTVNASSPNSGRSRGVERLT